MEQKDACLLTSGLNSQSKFEFVLKWWKKQLLKKTLHELMTNIEMETISSKSIWRKEDCRRLDFKRKTHAVRKLLLF